MRIMAGHSRSKNGVASLAYVPAIHVLLARKEDVDARHKPGMTTESFYAASAAFAFSTIAWNAAGSRIARSDSTLRSTATPALARPAMKRL
jgi:hypothetical protein